MWRIREVMKKCALRVVIHTLLFFGTGNEDFCGKVTTLQQMRAPCTTIRRVAKLNGSKAEKYTFVRIRVERVRVQLAARATV